jgi:hypothetical protein
VTEPIAPSTWPAVFALIAGAASIIVPAALGVVLYWLRNVKAQLDVAHALLVRQQRELQRNTEATTQIEKQTNGVLAAALDDVTKYKLWAERLDWIVRQINQTEEGRAVLDRIMRDSRISHDDRLARLLREPPS